MVRAPSEEEKLGVSGSIPIKDLSECAPLKMKIEFTWKRTEDVEFGRGW